VFGGSDEHGGDLGDLWMLRCDSAATGTASWELVAPKLNPTARGAATLSLVSLSDSPRPMGLLLFSGYGGGSFLNDVWLFDTRTAAWKMLLPHTAQTADASGRPAERYGHSEITHNSSSEVIIFGGITSDRDLNDVLSFNMCSRGWTLHECAGASPSPRHGHAACRVAESMYIFGGNSAGGSLNDLWEYALDARAWTQVVSTKGSAPSPRYGHSLISFGNRLVVFGGRDWRVANSFDSALHCFDLQRRRLIDLAVGGEGQGEPRGRSGHAAIPCEGGFLIFGGYASGRYFNDSFLLRVWP